MREILFRGLNYSKDKRFVYGFLQILYTSDNCVIIEKPDGQEWQVGPKTIGQYIGLKDKNDLKIFEGDKIQKYYKNKKEGIFEVYWCDVLLKWCLRDEKGNDYDNGDYYRGDDIEWNVNDYTVEIVGNIYDI